MENSTTTVREGYIKPADRIDYAVASAEIIDDKANNIKYLTRVLVDPEDDEADPITVNTFNPRLLAIWETELITKLGKLSATTPDEIAKLDPRRQVFKNAGRVYYKFPEPMYGLWGQDGQHTAYVNGMRTLVNHKKGEIVLSGLTGQPKTYEGVMVTIKYSRHDSEQETEGHSYAEACKEALRRFCPINANPVAPAQTNANPALEAGAQPPLTAEQMNQNPIPPQGMGQMPQQGMAGTASVNF